MNKVETCEHLAYAIVPGPTGPKVHCLDCGYSQMWGNAYPTAAAWKREYPQPLSPKGRVVQRALAEVLMHRGLPLSEPQWGLPITHAYAKGGGDPDYNCWGVALTRRAADESDWTTTVCLASGDSEIAALEAALKLAKYDSHPPLDRCIASYIPGGPACLSSD